MQTPNRLFPIDPHFLVLLFHLLSRAARVWLLTRFNVGWLTKTGNRCDAEMLIDSIREQRVEPLGISGRLPAHVGFAYVRQYAAAIAVLHQWQIG